MTRPVKRSFSIRGHRTSISLEAPFWDALKEAAARERVSLASLIASIDEQRGGAGLSSAVRIWILEDARAARAATSYDGGNRD
jgi:predicted DNA-binding ribbon-helix-helix protein